MNLWKEIKLNLEGVEENPKIGIIYTPELNNW